MSLLVLGGARSGKSRYAQGVAEAIRDGGGLAALYIATAQAWDREMEDRVAAHRAERDARWSTIEAPFDLADALASEAKADCVVLVDCLTLWLSNRMLRGDDVDACTASLVETLTLIEAGPVILVSNEVGAGIVPDNALARRFRDAQGRLNSAMAMACSHVVAVTAGLPLQLKPRDPPNLPGLTRR